MRNLNVIAVNDRAKVILKLNSSLLIVLRTFRGDLLCIINHLIEQYYIPPENYLPKDILKGKLKDIPKDELENSLKDKLKEKFGDNINFKVRDWERWFLLLKSENPNNTLIFLKTIIGEFNSEENITYLIKETSFLYSFFSYLKRSIDDKIIESRFEYIILDDFVGKTKLEVEAKYTAKYKKTKEAEFKLILNWFSKIVFKNIGDTVFNADDLKDKRFFPLLKELKEDTKFSENRYFTSFAGKFKTD